MFVSCNIRFHNNKGGTRPKPQFEHTSCSDVTMITHLRKNADISESELELLDFAQSEGLSCEAIQTEDWWASLHRWFTPRTRYCVSIVPPHSFSLKTVIYQRYYHNTNGNVEQYPKDKLLFSSISSPESVFCSMTELICL